jgi:nucleoporin NUP42
MRNTTNSSTTPHPLTAQPPAALHYTESLPLEPTQKNPQGKLTTYRGQPVTYVNNTPCYRRPDTRELEKIWFPNGAAGADVQGLNRDDKVRDCEGPPEAYTEDVLAEYRYLFEKGQWRGGKVPLVPPLREWAVYDF